MKNVMKRVLSGAMTLTLTSGMFFVPVGAAGTVDAFGRSFARVPGGTYYAEQTAPQVYKSHIENYECPERPGLKHVLEYQNVAATCTQDGIMARVCQVCGETEIVKEREALGHDYQREITREPTVHQEGMLTFTCSRCGDSYTETIPRLEQTSGQEENQPHIHVWTEAEMAATCTESGEQYRTCTACGARETLRSLPALGHDYQSQITRKPTATMTGLETFICTRCDDVYTEVLPKLGETAGQDQTQKPEQNPGQTVPSAGDGILTGSEPTGTCIDAFGRSYARVVGGTYYAEEYRENTFRGRIQSYNCPENPGSRHQLQYHKENPTCEEGDANYYYCTLCGEKEVYLDFPALGHEYTDQITRPATAQREGERTFTCTRCGDSYTESIPKLAAAAENPVDRDPSAQAAVTDNQGDNAYTFYHANPMKSYLYTRADGGYTRVEALENTVAVEVYDSDFRLLTSDTVPMELPRFGGFFAGESYNFLAFGQENRSESDSVEVIRVVKYDKNWNRLGQASLRGANTYIPFDSGSLRCAEYNGMLYVLTCHTMYTGSGGLNHQANMIIGVRQSDMAITDSQTRVSNIDEGYVSHSFNQFILVDQEGRIVTLNQGDAIPRGAMLIRYGLPAGEETFVNWGAKNTKIMSFTQSRDQYNYTGALMGGLAESTGNYLTAISTVPQTGYIEDHSVSNVVVTATSKSNFSGTRTHQLTSYAEGGSQSAGTPFLVKLSSNRFLVLWNILEKTSYGSFQLGSQVGYAFVDGSGQLIGSVQTAEAALSDCQPIYNGQSVVWYTTHNSAPVFYTIDGSTGDFQSVGTLPQENGQGNSTSGTVGGQAGAQDQPAAGQGGAAGQTGSSAFRDVSASYWGKPYIDKVYQAGLMTGTDTGSFDPTGNLTLAQVMVLAYQIHSQANGGTLPSVEGGWYMPYYQYCLDNGLVSQGTYSSGSLNQRATRFDMVEVLDRAIPASRMEAEKTVPDGAIPDLDEDDLHGDLVYKWYRAGLVTGDTQSRFNGEDGITRVETAVILCQINRLV